MTDLQHSLHRCAQARQYLKSAKAMHGSKALVVKALELYGQVLAEHGQEMPEPFFGLGYIAYAGGRPDLAIPFLQSGLKLAPNHDKMRQLLQRSQQMAQRQALQKAAEPKATESKPAEVIAPQGPIEALVSDLGPEQSDKISKGKEVEMLQKALQKLGHPVLLTGIYDRPTYTAVRAVQSLHKIPVTGNVDAATRDKLNPIIRVILAEQESHQAFWEICTQFTQAMQIELNEFQKILCTELIELMLLILQEFPTEEESVYTEADPPFAPREPLCSRLGNMGQMGIVSKGEEVRRVQQILHGLGYTVKVHEQFDLQTFSELSRFQLDQKLPISGIVEGPTQARLNELLQPIFLEEALQEALLQQARDFQQSLKLDKWPTIEKRRAALTEVIVALLKTGKLPEIPPEIAPFFQLQSELGPPNRPGKVSQGREVRLLQQALRKLGFNKIEINGSYDNETYAGVRSFQISKKLPMTGMVDAKSREELNQLILHILTRSDS